MTRRGKEDILELYFHHMKVLLVDDDQSLVQIVTSSLTQAGHSVFHAPTGKMGVDLAKTEDPDFILLDQILPDLTGLDILKTLKSDIATKNIPVVIFSAFMNTEAEEQALKLGALGYLLKYEVASDQIDKKIKEYLTAPKLPIT